jgi:lipoprotein-anchoring transpeptidase ErfK/SrfK
MTRQFLIAAALAGAVFAGPAEARKKAPPPPPPAPVIPQVHSGDAAVDAFYFYDRSGAPIWLRDDGGRQAAAKLAEVLDRAPIDGLAEGPALAASVRTAIAGGTLDNDAAISIAWLKYVRAMKAPVSGVEYGDKALMPPLPSAKEELSQLLAAPSMLVRVSQVAAVNPLYSSIREQALLSGSAADPRVKATLARLRLVPATGRAILVDVASAQLWMLENGQPVDSMKVVVGKTTSPTPLLAGTIHYVTFNPYWHILDDVARRKVAPIVMKRGVSYLKAAKYDTVASWSDPQPVDPSTIDWKAVAAGTDHVFIRQKPGVNNMMGAMKFSFENADDIFLHDTPHKELFAKAKRTLSLGCVRLEHADRLAQWLLGRDAAPPSDAPEQHVQIDQGVPVYLTYLTAKVEDGRLAFADDIYALDPAPTALANAEPDAPKPAADAAQTASATGPGTSH